MTHSPLSSTLTDSELDEQMRHIRNFVRLCAGDNFDETLDVIEDAARAHLSAMQGAGRWQPIETAPKDGTRVILAWPHAREGYWLDNSGTKYQPWSGWKLTAMDPWPQGQPTHWMPLPPTPSGEEQGNESAPPQTR